MKGTIRIVAGIVIAYVATGMMDNSTVLYAPLLVAITGLLIMYSGIRANVKDYYQ